MSDRVVTMYLGRVVEELTSGAGPDQIRHPYTRSLFSATPSLLEEIHLIVLSGPVPSAVRPPPGCPFHERCWKATAACAEEMPAIAVYQTSPRHMVRCHHPLTGDDAPEEALIP